ncbi:MAG: glycosyltransferase, partial [Armatimonadota bacterium]
KNFKWHTLRFLAMYSNNLNGNISEWIKLRSKNKSMYLNEKNIPQDKLYAILQYFETKIKRRDFSKETYQNVMYNLENNSHLPSASEVIENLQSAGNPVAIIGLVTLPDSKTHLDIGSNTGHTLKGFDASNITCIEAYPPAADELRKTFSNVIEDDALNAVDKLILNGASFDRITLLDFIEHLKRDDALKLLEKLEKLAKREIILFIPYETDELLNSKEYETFLREGTKLVPEGQRELQKHKSTWSTADFEAMGYDTLMIPNFHWEGFGAFFAIKHKNQKDREFIIKRINEYINTPEQTPAQPEAMNNTSNNENISNHPDYYESPREDIQSAVPLSAKTILDIGCANGGLGASLKKRQDCEITGIEIVHKAAEIAKTRLDKVYEGDAVQIIPTLPNNYYDCIILADSLEHIADPVSLLVELRKHLAEDGKIVVSIPNVRHWSVIAGLLEGRWDYEDAGLLDRTHLKFFTKYSFEKMLWHIGFKPIAIQPKPAQIVGLKPLSDNLIEAMKKEGLDVSTLKEESNIYHYLYVIEDAMAKTSSNDACSIIITTYNSEKTITQCLDAIALTIRPNDEVVVVDNNSRDKTVEIVRNYTKQYPQIKLIESKENLGFSAGTNLGIENSTNPYVVLLNPDTVTPNGWIDQLMAHFDDQTAAVGPVSNFAAGIQNMMHYITGKLPPNLTIVHLNNEFYKNNKGKSAETKMLIGFCMMIKRSALNEVGNLDNELFLGNDDLDLSWRFRLNNYKLKVALDTFVYHEGQHSFNTESKTKTNKLVQESTDILYKKLVNHYGDDNVPTPLELWGMDWFKPTKAKFNPKAKLLDKPISEKKEVAPKDDIKKSVEMPLTSIVILAHNQFEYTKKCVESIEKNTPEKHEIIIVDNASTDDTNQFFTEYCKTNQNIRLITLNENLGYAGGNNAGIAQSKGDYVVVMNNDVIVTPKWLSGMVEKAQSDPKVGIVGPMTNNVSGPQKINVTYDQNTLKGLGSFSRKWMENNKDKSIEFWRAVGFCMLVKKEVIEKIGGFDTRFGKGNFEDDDFCLRANIAGYKCEIAFDVFVHHFGSVTFANEKVDYSALLKQNWKIFADKWDIPMTNEYGKYDVSSILNTKFNEQKHYIPLTKEQPLIGKTMWIAAPSWNDDKSWQNILDKYFKTAHNKNVILSLYAGELTNSNPQEVYNKLTEYMKSNNIDPNTCPDIELTDIISLEKAGAVILSGGELDNKLKEENSDKVKNIDDLLQAA